MTPLEDAAMLWYRARLRQTQAANALRTYRVEHGGCEFAEAPYYEDGHYAGGRGPCYSTTETIDEWCDVCRDSQPLWEARQLASAERGAKLRSLTRLLAKMEQELSR